MLIAKRLGEPDCDWLLMGSWLPISTLDSCHRERIRNAARHHCIWDSYRSRCAEFKKNWISLAFHKQVRTCGHTLFNPLFISSVSWHWNIARHCAVHQVGVTVSEWRFRLHLRETVTASAGVCDTDFYIERIRTHGKIQRRSVGTSKLRNNYNINLGCLF